jgi:hypothetical protein
MILLINKTNAQSFGKKSQHHYKLFSAILRGNPVSYHDMHDVLDFIYLNDSTGHTISFIIGFVGDLISNAKS